MALLTIKVTKQVMIKMVDFKCTVSKLPALNHIDGRNWTTSGFARSVSAIGAKSKGTKGTKSKGCVHIVSATCRITNQKMFLFKQKKGKKWPHPRALRPLDGA